MPKELSETEAMLVVIYKKLDNIEKKMNNSSRMASLNSYYEELKREADKLIEEVNEKKA